MRSSSRRSRSARVGLPVRSDWKRRSGSSGRLDAGFSLALSDGNRRSKSKSPYPPPFSKGGTHRVDRCAPKCAITQAEAAFAVAPFRKRGRRPRSGRGGFELLLLLLFSLLLSPPHQP